jgi:hypothetical protein
MLSPFVNLASKNPTILVSNQGSDQLNVNAISHFNFERGMILWVLGVKESVLFSQTRVRELSPKAPFSGLEQALIYVVNGVYWEFAEARELTISFQTEVRKAS